MKNLFRRATESALLHSVSAMLLLTPSILHAQSAAPRIGRIDSSAITTIAGSKSRVLAYATDSGRVAGNTVLPGLTMRFALSATQQADLRQLLAAQQQKDSPEYHHWLTPEQFATRFGAAASDVAVVSQWLTSQGFIVTTATPLRISFTGKAAQVEAAFHTQMHNYALAAKSGSTVAPKTFMANATPISLPTALAHVVTGVEHLSTLRPTPLHHDVKLQKLNSPNYTSGATHALVPDDVRTIYNVSSLYNAGYTGAGQKIVVIGQSTVDLNDIALFDQLFGGNNTNVITTLVPDTGDAVSDSDDEMESDLDLEYSGAMAKDATIYFFYAGGSGNAFDAISYAVEQNSAPTISISYGACELDMTSSDASGNEQIFDQANSQGQSLVAAAGDSGATGCDHGFSTANEGLALQFPADSPDVTGIGGTEFNEGSGTYWNTSNNSLYASALGYIPEMVWNDSAITVPQLEGLAAGGGGVSILYAKPSWQVASGVPADGARDVPDISLAAASQHDPYFLCGAPDSNGNNCANGYIYQAGGTSFGAPIFSGILALIGQARGEAQGNINPEIYTLAAQKPAAFHDITVGNNDSPCTPGSTDCPSGITSVGYNAIVGYDLATGLGSIDAYSFGQGFPGFGTSSPKAASTTKLSVNPATPTSSSALTLQVQIESSTSGTPSGTVQFSLDGVAQGTPVMLSSGAASISSAALAAGAHSLAAVYSGDTTFAAVGGSLEFTVAPLPITSTVISLLPAAPTTSSSIVANTQVTSSTTGTITGTVQYALDGASLGNPQTITNGLASYTLGMLTAGLHSLKATYSGDANFAASTGLTSFTVTSASTAQVSLSISPTNPQDTDNVTATATLTNGATGTVQFSIDGTAVGTGIPIVGGFAIGQLGTLTTGVHKIGAMYSGDATFAPASTNSSITVSSGSGAFTISATNVTLSSGQSASSTVTLQSTANYAGTVLLTLTGKGPSDACYAIGANPTVQVGGTATTTIRFFSGTGCVIGASVHRFRGERIASNRILSTSAIELAFSLGGLFFAFGTRRRKQLRALTLAAILAFALGTLSGCGGSATSNPNTGGTYTLTLMGTDSAHGSNNASTTFTLTE